jgi:DNA-binding NarL/FixJ family response regulator
MSITVLLADDHGMVRDGLRFLLQAQQDIEVVGDAANGREAVHLVTRLRPKIVVMDIAMPELNGIDATRQIREECPTSQVIILSMYSDTERVQRALHAGARGYLLKESAGIELVRAVRTVYAGHAYLSQEIADQIVNDYVVHGKALEIPNSLERLSPREREILQLVVEGKTSAEIAGILSLSAKTVDTYRSRLMDKLGIGNLPALVKFAIQQGLIELA